MDMLDVFTETVFQVLATYGIPHRKVQTGEIEYTFNILGDTLSLVSYTHWTDTTRNDSVVVTISNEQASLMIGRILVQCCKFAGMSHILPHAKEGTFSIGGTYNVTVARANNVVAVQ